MITSLITTAYSRSLGTTSNVFDLLSTAIQEHHDRPCTTLAEIGEKNTKKKGDLWESFCLLYLKHVKSYDNVWLLKDIPSNVRESLGLKTRDIGIDIVAERKGAQGSTYVAVQCKFKSPNKWRKKTSVGWKELSTFYSLCARTGPWDRHIVMFNMDYVSHMGYKGEKDLSYCIGTFRNITKDQWEKMCGYKVHTLMSTPDSKDTQPLTPEQLREARLKRLT